MDWITIGLSLVTIGALVVFVTRPWWVRHRYSQAKSGSTPDTSLAKQREATLTVLRDLEFDYEVGKVTEEDYALLRQTLLANAAAIFTQIEQEQTAAQSDLDARIQDEFLATRQNLNGRQVSPSPAQNYRTCPTCSQVSLAGDLYCRTCGTQLPPACPECGQAVTPTDHFCVKCGFELALAVVG